MLLPDGKLLIMDQELYQKTIEKSIVLDLYSNSQSEKDPLIIEDLNTPSINRKQEEEKYGTGKKKMSQAT